MDCDDRQGAFAVWMALTLHCLGSGAHSPVKHPESTKWLISPLSLIYRLQLKPHKIHMVWFSLFLVVKQIELNVYLLPYSWITFHLLIVCSGNNIPLFGERKAGSQPNRITLRSDHFLKHRMSLGVIACFFCFSASFRLCRRLLSWCLTKTQLFQLKPLEFWWTGQRKQASSGQTDAVSQAWYSGGGSPGGPDEAHCPWWIKS